MFEPTTTVTVGWILQFATLAAILWKGASWVRGLVDESAKEIRAELKEKAVLLHKRVDRSNEETHGIRKEYVLRVDFDRHIQSVEKRFDGFDRKLDAVSEQSAQILGRLGDRQS